MDTTSTAFITAVANQKSERTTSINDKLHDVRLQHKNLMQVVDIFRSKVDIMVEKQRNDFMLAYEAHVYDFQKELIFLKQRVKDIVNDNAREEKVKQLNLSKEYYRSEALRLDIETNNLDKSLRNLTSKTQKLEKERDWLLKKLRSAKTHLMNLETSYLSYNNSNSDGTVSLFSSSESVMSFEVKSYHTGATKENDHDLTTAALWKSRLASDFNIKRDIQKLNSLSIDPEIQNAMHGQAKSLSHKLREKVLNSYSIGFNQQTSSMSTVNPSQSLFEPEQPQLQPLPQTHPPQQHSYLGDVVKMRVVHEDIVEFIKGCQVASMEGSWTKIKKRELTDILHDARSKPLNDYFKLATELSIQPDLYNMLYAIISDSYHKENPVESSDVLLLQDSLLCEELQL